MAGELSREMKRKIDAMERINKGDMSPSIFEGATGTQTIIDPSAYTQTFLPGLNISFGTSGDSKTINAVMNLLAGSNITISEPDANGQVTITGNIGGKAIDIANLVDGYVITWDTTSQKFILAEAASPLAMATETTLGGIKAKDKTTETGEVAIDPTTGKLFAPSSGGSGTYVAIGIVDGGDPDSTYPDVPIPGLLPSGGTAGQIPSKVDGTDYNVEWVDHPSENINSLPTWSNGGLDRRFLVRATASGGSTNDPGNTLSAGPINSFYWNSGTTTKVLSYEFPVPNRVTGIGFLQNGTTANGIWTLSGSNDNANWTDIINDYVLGGPSYGPNFVPPGICYIREFANDIQYKHYRLTLNSGNATSSGPYVQQCVFKCEAI